VVDSVVHYFSGVSAIKWEFSSMTKNLEHYMVALKTTNYATDAFKGTMVVLN
jgi:hypothetical protein